MNALEQKLVDALRSDKYKQARGRLRENDTFCCLGVGCDISGIGTWNPLNNNVYLTEDESGPYTSGSVLPYQVQNAFGWSNDTGVLTVRQRDGVELTLAVLNDEGFTFPQIADLIAAGLVETKEEYEAKRAEYASNPW